MATILALVSFALVFMDQTVALSSATVLTREAVQPASILLCYIPLLLRPKGLNERGEVNIFLMIDSVLRRLAVTPWYTSTILANCWRCHQGARIVVHVQIG